MVRHEAIGDEGSKYCRAARRSEGWRSAIGSGEVGGRCGGERSRSRSRCLPACVARCSSLPFPSLPTGHDGRWMDADGIPLSLPCRGGPQKGKPAAPRVGPPPRLPSVRSQMNGRAASRARAALKRLALASAWLPPPGWRAGPARAGCGVGGLLTSGAAGSRTMRDGRLGRRGRSASGESELLRRLGARNSSGGSGGAWDEPATAHPRFCKSALHCFWIPRLFLSPALSDLLPLNG